jgi:hypothetical protein
MRGDTDRTRGELVDPDEIGIALSRLHGLYSSIKSETIRKDIWEAYSRIADLVILPSMAVESPHVEGR